MSVGQNGMAHSSSQSNRGEASPLDPIRVLLVDDSPEFVVAASDFFFQRRARFDTVGVAFSVSDALEFTRKFRPDLVVMDYVLPTVNGADGTRALKKLKHPPRVFILSVHNSPEYQESALAAGADAYLLKDNMVEHFEPMVDRLFAEPTEPGGSEASPQLRDRARKLNHGARIVLVDDDEVTQNMVGYILRGAGYRVEITGTGQGGEELVREFRPHLVLLDVGLPDISGLEVCRRIKDDPIIGHTMIMHLSATHVSDGDIRTGLEGGADAYYSFPIRQEPFLQQVDGLVRMALLEEARGYHR